LKVVEELAGIGIPYFAANGQRVVMKLARDRRAHAVKSAEAVAAVAASGLSFACQTAPLWPRKVPILFCDSKQKVDPA